MQSKLSQIGASMLSKLLPTLLVLQVLTACGAHNTEAPPVSIVGISEAKAHALLSVAVSEASKHYPITLNQVFLGGFSVELVSEEVASEVCKQPALGCFVVPQRRILVAGTTECDQLLVLGHEYLHLIAAVVGAPQTHRPPLFRSWDRSESDWGSAESQVNLEIVENLCSAEDSITLLGYSIVYGTLLNLKARGISP